MFKAKTYKNSAELANLSGVPIYMSDMVDASLRGRLNTFLQGNTGSGKTQLVRDVMQYFGDKSLFILGRNDMDTRELFQQVNPEFLKALKEQRDISGMRFKELTDKVNYHFIAVDELPNCVPAVRAQLFNLFDGFIEIDGKAYPIGSGYSVGMATGNIGQQFTESSNELGRALKDRMHLIIDTDYYRPQPIDTLDMLEADRNPRVNFGEKHEDKTKEIIESHKNLRKREISDEKYILANYLIHGLDYLPDEFGGSKTALKSGWPNKLEGHALGSDEALILPVSPRAAKSIITLSQALDSIVEEKGAEPDHFNSMMTAFKFASAYSGILNQAIVMQNYDENPYKAMDAVIETTKTQFKQQEDKIIAGLDMAGRGKKSERLLNEFQGRWGFMRNILESLADRQKR
ncbi:AAA family ATPase [Candidatus Woesearchaeota archaeon]|nr:AAA family ATPase [Candidatus Woesearchaeota archaeon]